MGGVPPMVTKVSERGAGVRGRGAGAVGCVFAP